MLKLLTATTLSLLLLSGFLGYKLYTAHQTDPMLTKVFPATCKSMQYDYSTSGFEGVINFETAKIMAENYKNDAAKAFITANGGGDVNTHVAPEDTRSVWFSFERLKNFLWHIENQNCLHNCGDSLGLRIYFGKYPDFKEVNATTLVGLETVPKEYANHHTLFMVPTYKNESNDNIDFYPGGNNCRTPFTASPTHSVAPENISTVHDASPYIFLMGTYEDAQNHGGLIPPGSATGTSF